MDKLYIGDIPTQYHFARFGNGYIDLYNTNVLHNGTYDFYRVYTNNNGFYYSFNSANYNAFVTEYANPIEVTDNVCYRTDFDSILTITLIISVFAIFLFNIITSLINKGGLLGGLL